MTRQKTTFFVIATLIFSGIFVVTIFGMQNSATVASLREESFNLGIQTADWPNTTLVSDGYNGVYWNDDWSGDCAIATGPDNVVHVVWEDFTQGIWGVDVEIMYASYTPRKGWSNATVISDGYQGIYWNDGISSAPDIAVDAAGVIHVVWYDDTSSPLWGVDEEIMYVKYVPGVGWSNVTVISDGYGGIYWNDDRSMTPAIAVSKTGTVHVVWEDDTNSPTWGVDWEIMYVNYTASNGWSNVTVISDGYGGNFWNNGDSNKPTIALEDSGNVHVVWTDGTNSPLWGVDEEIMYVKYVPGTGWSNATVISDGYNGIYWNNDWSTYPDIAVDNKGGVHVVWQDDTGGIWGDDLEIMYAKYSPNPGWSNATVISDGYNGTYWNDDDSSNPSIAVDTTGRLHVVWDDYSAGIWGTDSEIMYASYDSENGWSNITVISDGYNGIYWNSDNSDTPEIAIDGKNTIHVVWQDYTYGAWGNDVEIWYVSLKQPSVGADPLLILFLMLFPVIGICIAIFVLYRRRNQ